MASRAERLLPYIYWEKQEPGSMLCAQHALNNLMQSPIWTADDLAVIARKLDEMEDATFDEELKAKRRGRSANYDDSGFFSLQVLDSALQALGLCLVRWRSSVMKPFHPYPENQSAFIFNHHLHWLTLRRFGDQTDSWYNLDSTLGMAQTAGSSSYGYGGATAGMGNAGPQGPQWVGPAFLGMTIEQAEREGYSVFCVRPIASTTTASSSSASAASSSSSSVGGQSEVEPDLAQRGGFLHACEADDMAFELATLGRHHLNGNGKRRPRGEEDDEDEERAGSSRRRPRLSDEEREMSEDEQLRRAIEASLLDDRPSPVPPGAVPSGTKNAPLNVDSSPVKPAPQEEEEEEEQYEFEEDDDYGISFSPVKLPPKAKPVPASAPSAPFASGSGPSTAQADEDAELEAAIKASLEQQPGNEGGPGNGSGGQVEGEGAEEEWDEPSPEELRRRRLARFG